jgi:putative transport protein
MNSAVELLSGSPLLLLFVVVGLGSLIGHIKVFGFSLGPAAVLFVGLFFGAMDSRLRIPELFYVLGLILFVYTIGLQSGPSFFTSFGRRSLRANGIAFGAILLAAVICVGAGELMGLAGSSIVGVFCGSLTNTPALAASVEAMKNEISSGAFRDGAAPVIAYGVSYPFGVIGVLVGFHLFAKLQEKRTGPPTRDAGASSEVVAGPIAARTFKVVNAKVIGRTVAGIMSDEGKGGFVLSRLRRGEVSSLVYAETVLEKGDLIVAVGDPAALERARQLFGKVSPREIHVENQEFDVRRIEVSDKKVVGRSVADLELQDMLDATITRVRRGDTDLVPTADTILERGDRVRVVTWAGNMDRVARFFGDSIRSSSETDFVSLSVGLLLGVLLGMIPLPLPRGGRFALGFAGGPLIAGLLLGRLQRTGPMVWGMPFGVNLTLRQVGLVLFLAGIGTKAGDGLLATLAGGGWKMMLLGACVTSVVTVGVLSIGVRRLRLSYAGVMGLVAGIQTQPACLAYANERTSSNAPNVWYASVYPVSMIAKILLAQSIVWWLA